MSIVISIILVVNIVAFIYVLLAGYDGLVRLVLSLLGLSGYAETLHNSPHERLADADNTMPTSIILPDCDKDLEPQQTVLGLLDLDFPEYEVIAVCDAASGNSLPKLVEAFDMIPVRQPIRRVVEMRAVRTVYRSPKYPSLIVLDKESGGRHDAINAGINVSRFPLFITLTAGSVLRRDALRQITAPFMKSFKVVAVGGLPRVGGKNGEVKGFIPSMEEAEYLRNFPAGLAVPSNNKLPLIPGAFCAFRKKPVMEAGGFVVGGSETEMMLRLKRVLMQQQRSNKVELFSEPVFNTEPPRGLGGLFRQRRVWQKDLVTTMWRNKSMTFNPKYRRVGMFDMPYYWLFDVLGPIIELIGCISIPVCFALGLVGWELMLGFLAAEVLLGMVVSLAGVASQQIIDDTQRPLGKLVKLVVCALANNILYRQLILLFRVMAMFMPRPAK